MDLENRFSLDVLFNDFCEGVALKYPLGRAGIVRVDPVENEFVMMAQWSSVAQRASSGTRRFEREKTVGNWVLKNRRRFVGSTREDVRRFSATFSDFEEEGFQSNFVDLIDSDRLQLFFALSSEPDAFAVPAELLKHIGLLSHCVSLSSHFTQPALQSVLSARMESLMQDLMQQFGKVPTQEQIDHCYFSSLMTMSNGKVDGAFGAASMAGVKPSTFRSRLRKAGL
jgi:hypothetical protein